MVSSANSLHLMLMGGLSISMPFIGEFLIAAASGSIPRSKSKQERPSPWRTPRFTGKGSLIMPFMMIEVEAFS